MFIKYRLRTALLALVLFIGVFTGISMRPQDIEEMTHRGRHAKSEQTLKDEGDLDDDEKGSDQ